MAFDIFFGHVVYLLHVEYFHAMFNILWHVEYFHAMFNILWHVEYFYAMFNILWHVEYFNAMWSFGIFPPILVYSSMKNLATLSHPMYLPEITSWRFDRYQIVAS
jgi:hypothetical protein